MIVRDHGHAGMRLADFAALELPRAADLTLAEVAAVRLYSGESITQSTQQTHTRTRTHTPRVPCSRSRTCAHLLTHGDPHAGPMYAPLNYALRTEAIAEWAVP